MSVTGFYAGLFGLMFVLLSIRIVRLRRRLHVGIGHRDQPLLERAIRVHSNFAEYVPLSLLLMYFLESATRSPLWPHALCVALGIGRIVHAYGVSQDHENYRFRVIGMSLTFGVIVFASLGLLACYARSLAV